VGNPILVARERANLAAALSELAKAASTVERFWPEFGLPVPGMLGDLPPDVPGYPFSQSFDELAADISTWANAVREWAQRSFVRAEAWRLQQQTRADEAGIEFDELGPELAICDHCGALYQFVMGPNAHTCPGLEAEGQASARENRAAHGDDR
jgi:hypothetical protein